MASFYSYPGQGQVMTDAYGYSQTVSVPASARLVFCSGQGGWNEDGSMPESYEEQVVNAFK